MKIRTTILSFLFAFFTTHSFAQDGKELFQNNCTACHTIGKGKLVGPDLIDIDKKYPEAHLIKWIKSSTSVIKSGDKNAIKLFEEYSNIVMPDQKLSDAEIKSVITYIKTESETQPITATATSAQTQSAPSGTQSSSASSNGSATTKNFLTDNPNSLFKHLDIFLIAIFFLSIIWVLSRVINTLSKALSEEYAKNKSKSE